MPQVAVSGITLLKPAMRNSTAALNVAPAGIDVGSMG